MESLKELYEDAPLIEQALGYTFNDKTLLVTAFIHCSYVNEHRDIHFHNERLEFLGDSVIGMIIAEYLYRQFPEKPEGDLSSLRSRLVEASSCAAYLEKLDVENFLRLGKGERQTNSRGKLSIHADLFEAVVGAIFVDGGVDAAKKFIFDKLHEEIDERIHSPADNWKALYQDLCQKHHHETPKYTVTGTSGPEHQKVFDVAVSLNDVVQGTGQGHSKKEAQQSAALKALQQQFPTSLENPCP